MGRKYQFGILANEKKNLSNSEIAARDEFNRRNPPLEGLAVPHDLRKMELLEDTGLLRTLRLHQIERHPTQLPNPQVASTRQEDGSETQLVQGDGTEYTVDAVAADAVPADEADGIRR